MVNNRNVIYVIIFKDLSERADISINVTMRCIVKMGNYTRCFNKNLYSGVTAVVFWTFLSLFLLEILDVTFAFSDYYLIELKYNVALPV